MATESVNISEDAEMAECDGDKVVTMMDVLQEQQEFEDDANAVLGASDDKNCTYAKGYIKRQAIYACLTCCPDVRTDPTKRAGVCLACSLNCHENHELVELYTKRNFRCDCGNPKFNSHPCQFTPNKTELNEENIYNQNFSGLYCTCQRPYPDPESTFEDDMIQCIICEDWLHASHLDAVVPSNDQYSEMICKNCMEKNEFLHDYSNLAVNVECADIDIINVNGNVSIEGICNGDKAKEVLENGKTDSEQVVVSNTVDIQMAEDKNESKPEAVEFENGEIEKQDETNASSMESKETEDSVDAVPENTSEKSTENINLDTESHKEQTPQCIDSKETNEDTKKDDDSSSIQDTITENTNSDISKDDETPKVNENNSVSEQPIEPPPETQEQFTSDMKSDTSKTEDQKLDNIKELTSDHPQEDTVATAESPAATAESPAAEPQNNEEPTKIEEDSQELANIDKVEQSCLESADVKTDSTEDQPTSETETTNVKTDTSLQEQVKENTEDKTDAVMDAIDELLKSPSKSKDIESQDSDNDHSQDLPENERKTEENAATVKSNEEEMDKSEEILNDKVSENTETSTTDCINKNDADIEMTEDNSKDEPSTTVNKENENDKVSENTETSTDCITKNDTDVDMSELKGEDDVDKKNENVAPDNTHNVETSGNLSDTLTSENKEANDGISNKNESSNETDNAAKTESSKEELSTADNELSESTENSKENKRKLSVEVADTTSPKKAKLDICVRPKGVKKVYKGATFWPSTFRQKLCTCGECISMYKDLHVLFLTDLEDTVSAYESLGKENVDGGASQYEKGLQALSSLDRIQQINALTEYNKMRDKLLDFLKSFKDRKEVVKEEDIKAFFAGMKPKREPDGVYFCR